MMQTRLPRGRGLPGRFRRILRTALDDHQSLHHLRMTRKGADIGIRIGLLRRVKIQLAGCLRVHHSTGGQDMLVFGDPFLLHSLAAEQERAEGQVLSSVRPGDIANDQVVLKLIRVADRQDHRSPCPGFKIR